MIFWFFKTFLWKINFTFMLLLFLLYISTHFKTPTFDRFNFNIWLNFCTIHLIRFKSNAWVVLLLHAIRFSTFFERSDLWTNGIRNAGLIINMLKIWWIGPCSLQRDHQLCIECKRKNCFRSRTHAGDATVNKIWHKIRTLMLNRPSFLLWVKRKSLN